MSNLEVIERTRANLIVGCVHEFAFLFQMLLTIDAENWKAVIYFMGKFLTGLCAQMGRLTNAHIAQLLFFLLVRLTTVRWKDIPMAKYRTDYQKRLVCLETAMEELGLEESLLATINVFQDDLCR